MASNLLRLDVSNNQICDTSPITFLEKIENINIENNLITDVLHVHYLLFCGNLKTLFIGGNPVCDKTDELGELSISKVEINFNVNSPCDIRRMHGEIPSNETGILYLIKNILF
ncbi:uncharacterized protein LOC115228436 [Octopus sinensis]|uniref:Uncharacterized protein LOC115228436 n=1 Tax=Octopus sinensis TaxID=2607531 RepID=A0A6P7TRL7_9MOLL|nr:uncharacterized protein LOC115228436 [Octopus sinensis]